MKNCSDGVKSSRSLDRTDYLQTEMNLERDECKQKYISDRPWLSSWLWNKMHARKSAVKRKMATRAVTAMNRHATLFLV
jgi:hypothetical protein